MGLIERQGDALYNSAAVVCHGKLAGVYRKTYLLPGESKVFRPGTGFPLFETGGKSFGVNICYDLQFQDCAMAVAESGAELLVCPCNNMLKQSTAEEYRMKHHEIRAER